MIKSKIESENCGHYRDDERAVRLHNKLKLKPQSVWQDEFSFTLSWADYAIFQERPLSNPLATLSLVHLSNRYSWKVRRDFFFFDSLSLLSCFWAYVIKRIVNGKCTHKNVWKKISTYRKVAEATFF